MKISNSEVKKVIIECLISEDNVTKQGGFVARTSFKREHIKKVNSVLKKITDRNIVSYEDERGATIEKLKPEFLKIDIEERKKFKNIQERTSGEEVEFTKPEIDVIRFYLNDREYWPFMNEKCFDEIETILKGE